MWFLFALCATIAQAASDTADSAIVRHEQKDPLLIMFITYGMGLALLAALLPRVDMATAWTVPLLCAGTTLYIADYAYYRIINHIDISTINAAWAMHALYLSVAGFVLFQEHWSATHAAGAASILSGVLMLSLWGNSASIRGTFIRYACLALLYVPVHIVRKMASAEGVDALTLFLLPLLAYCLVAVAAPLVKTPLRTIIHNLQNTTSRFICLICITLASNFAGSYLFVRALASGPLSLSSVVITTQPFFVMLLARVLSATLPAYAPREEFTKRKTGIKIVSFVLVGGGMALLGGG